MECKDHAFSEWLNAPVEFVSPDPRFEFRRANPDEFPRIYRLVDEVWERHTPRAHYDWLYLKNPLGIARCCLVFEIASGDLVKCWAGFPWPIAHATEQLKGRFGGDGVTVPRFQRQGLNALGFKFNEAHPWYGRTANLAAPNANARASGRKHGLSPPLGPLPRATLVLDWARLLCAHSVPRGSARVMGRAADGLMNKWRSKVIPSCSDVGVEELTRFDSSLDQLTFACMRTPTYWCPHDADFLNWRYLDNPRNSYVARVALTADEPTGYSVIRVDGERALLMEFVAPTESATAGSLMRGTVEAAREAGCNGMDFYATSSWRFWPLFRQFGFVNRKSEVYINARHPDGDGASLEQNWQLLPGDSDVT